MAAPTSSSSSPKRCIGVRRSAISLRDADIFRWLSGRHEEPRRNGIHPHATRRPILRRAYVSAEHAVLAHGIGRAELETAMGGDRGDIDDASRPRSSICLPTSVQAKKTLVRLVARIWS